MMNLAVLVSFSLAFFIIVLLCSPKARADAECPYLKILHEHVNLDDEDEFIFRERAEQHRNALRGEKIQDLANALRVISDVMMNRKICIRGVLSYLKRIATNIQSENEIFAIVCDIEKVKTLQYTDIEELEYDQTDRITTVIVFRRISPVFHSYILNADRCSVNEEHLNFLIKLMEMVVILNY